MKSEGPKIIKFIETYLRHSEGDAYGKPIRLRQWQKGLINDMFALDARGRRRYSRALVGMPKGNGKSELGAAIMAYLLFTGPSPVIPIAAASFEQADIPFGALKAMISQSPDLASLCEIRDTEIRLADAPGRAFRVAAIGPTNDGLKPSDVLFDEVHELVGGKERMHLVISNGLTKRADAFELNITTAGVAGTDTLCERLYRRGLEGPDPRLFFQWFSASDHWDLSDPEQRREAVLEANPAAGPAGWLDPDVILRRFDEIPANEWCRYHLNRWTASVSQWLPVGAWEALAAPGRVVEPGSAIVAGFDGSYSRDSTALVGCTLDPPHHVFVIAHWARPVHDPDWRVPRAEVEAMIADMFEIHDVRALACDPPGWHRELEDWEARWPGKVIPFDWNVRTRSVPACGKFFSAVVAGELSHDGSPALAEHLRNAEAKAGPWGTAITKHSKDDSRKIDLAVAAVIAYDAASHAPPARELVPLVAFT